MRILYQNEFDVAASLTPLTEETLYEATNVQDQRLTTQWRTTSATDQTIIFDASSATIVGGNIGLVTGSAATNLVTDPDITNWSQTNVTTSADTAILGSDAFKITLSTSSSTVYARLAVPSFSITNPTIMATVRKGNVNSPRLTMFNTSTASVLAIAEISFAAKTITYASCSEAMPPVWIDDETVEMHIAITGVSTGSSYETRIAPTSGAGGTGDYSIFSRIQLIDNTYPVPYVATSRTAVDTSYNFRLPPSGKFIVDAEFFPFIPFDSTTRFLFGWYPGAASNFYAVYNATLDKFRLNWFDGGTNRTMDSQQFFASTLNTYIRYTASIDLDSGVAGDSKLYINNTLIASSWSNAPDILSSSTLTTLDVGSDVTAEFFDGIFRRFRVYGGNFSATTATSITSETSLDTALADHTLLFDQTYQNQFNFDTVAIMGHNISEGASITMQANDYNEWNYTDGSGSSIIQETLTWDDQAILKMRTKSKKQYIKFSINDPNNDDGIIKIGRIWAGPYLDIDPSSLDDFQVAKRRSDRNIYSRDRVKWSDVGVGWRRFELRFPRTATTMLEKIQTMYDEVGNHTSIIFCNFDTLRSYDIVEPCYCSIDGDIVFNHRGRQKYTYSLNLEEDR